MSLQYAHGSTPCRCFGLLISPGKDVKNSEMNLLDNMVGYSCTFCLIGMGVPDEALGVVSLRICRNINILNVFECSKLY